MGICRPNGLTARSAVLAIGDGACFAVLQTGCGEMDCSVDLNQIHIGFDGRRCSGTIDGDGDHFRLAEAGGVVGVADLILELVETGFVGGPVANGSRWMGAFRLHHIDDLAFFACRQGVVRHPCHRALPLADGSLGDAERRVGSAGGVVHQYAHGVGVHEALRAVLHHHRIGTAVFGLDIGDDEFGFVKSPLKGISGVVLVQRFAVMIPCVDMVAAVSSGSGSDRHRLS